jgi:hypothetical protein
LRRAALFNFDQGYLVERTKEDFAQDTRLVALTNRVAKLEN